MAVENLSTLRGTIYSKETKTWPNKKAGEPDYEFNYFKLEYSVMVRGRTVTPVVEFTADRGISMEEFSQGDHVEVDYYPMAKDIKKKDGSGSWTKKENIAVYVRFSDITTPSMHQTMHGKIKVESMTDPAELENPKKMEPPEREKVFIPPRPDDDLEDDQLPF